MTKDMPLKLQVHHMTDPVPNREKLPGKKMGEFFLPTFPSEF